jgi:hypothetical protein
MRGVGTNSLVWSRIAEIKDFPDIQGMMEGIDKTTTFDNWYLYQEGIKTNEQRSFACNYNESDFRAIQALEGMEIPIAVWFGVSFGDGINTPDGSLGKFVGRGYVNVYVNGSGVDEVVDMTIVITMTQSFVEAWDPLLLEWTTNTGEVMQDNNGNVMYFDISHGGSKR